MGVLAEMGCRDEATAAARRLIPTLPRYAGRDEFGVSVFNTIATNALRGGDTAAALAAFDEGTAALGADNPYALTLTFNAAFLALGTGDHGNALERVARVEAVSPSYGYGVATAHYIRALAYDGMGKRKERDAALDYLAANASGNPMAALLAIGLLRGYDKAVALIEDRARVPADARQFLDGLHARPDAPVASDLEGREQALLARLRADPRVIAALKPVGRILTLPESKTCPMTAQELAARPFQYPFEGAPIAGNAGPAEKPTTP
jgi:hypothetical protein